MATGLIRRFRTSLGATPSDQPGLIIDDLDDTYVVDRDRIAHLLTGTGTGFTPGAALDLVAGVLSVLVDGVTVTINGDNKLVAASGGGSPSGPAGGALDGAYPDPDLAATLAGSGLEFLANVLSVLVDASTIVINGAGELEVGPVVIQAGSPAGGVLSGTFPDPDFAIDMATQAELDAVSAALQAAITALAAAAVLDGDAAGGVLSGSYPNPGFAVDMATQAELNALAASAVLDGDSAGGVLSGTFPNPGFAVDMATQAELNALSASAVLDGDAAGGDITGTFPAPTLAAIVAAAGPIGDATHIAAVTIDAKGRVTALTSVAITAPPLGIVGTVASNGAVSAGTGFTVNKTGTGTYVVTFGAAMAATPVVIVTVATTANTPIAIVGGETVNGFTVHTFNPATHSDVDAGFHFLATPAH